MTSPTSTPVEEKHIDFEGNLLVNTRTIINTNEFFQSITGPGPKRKTITIGELSELLVLLETIASSHDLVYDATVPEREIARIKAAEDALETRIGNSSVFAGIKPDTDDLTLALCKAGIQQSSALLHQRISIFASAAGDFASSLPDIRPISANNPSPRLFAEELLKAIPPTDERDAYLVDLIERNPFNGAKCVAGILATDPEEDHVPGTGAHQDIRGLCRKFVADRSDEELRWIVPMLINTFRSNFLNSLAAEHGKAAFFAGPDIEHVKEQQVFLLGNYVAGQLTESQLEPEILESALKNRLQDTNQFPFLGLLILLAADDGDPFSVFRLSLSDKDKLHARFLAEKSKPKRYIHDFSSDELADFKKELLDRVFRKLERRVQLHDAADRANHHFLQPSISWYPYCRPLLNAALNRFEAEFRAMEIPGGMGAAATYLINLVMMPGEYLRYATFTHRIRKRLDLILRNRGEQDVITERVSKVLGCEIVDG